MDDMRITDNSSHSIVSQFSMHMGNAIFNRWKELPRTSKAISAGITIAAIVFVVNPR